MPIIKSAIKQMHQTAKRRARNVHLKNDIKSAIKAFRAKPTATTLSSAQGMLDTAVKKKLLKANTANRRKAQLFAEAKAANVKLGAQKAAKPTVPKPAAKAVPKKTAAKKPAAKKTPVKKVTPKKATKKA